MSLTPFLNKRKALFRRGNADRWIWFVWQQGWDLLWVNHRSSTVTKLLTFQQIKNHHFYIENLAKDNSGNLIDAFESTLGYVQNDFIPRLAQNLDQRNTFTLVQFSGVSQLEAAYVPNSNGEAGSGLAHYKVEIPTHTQPVQ